MTGRLHYGTTAKALHWAIAMLFVLQYSIGWLMPDVHGGPPGTSMTWHINRYHHSHSDRHTFFVRVTHPVAPESSLPPWQRLTSEAVHWLLYLLVLLTTLSGWLPVELRRLPRWSFAHALLVEALRTQKSRDRRTAARQFRQALSNEKLVANRTPKRL